MKNEHDQLEEARKKVDKEKKQIVNQLRKAMDTQSRLREELENAEEQGRKRVQDVYAKADFQLQKLRDQLEMKEKNNSALRESNNVWALINSSSDLPCSNCAANISFNSVILKDLLEQERKMEITIDETVSKITFTKDYDNDNHSHDARISGVNINNSFIQSATFFREETREGSAFSTLSNTSVSALDGAVPFETTF